MSKKSLRLQTNKMLVAALFALLCVGLYAHVDSYVNQKELANVLGTETSTESGFSKSKNFLRMVWCRLRYGIKCSQTTADQQTGVSEDSMTVDQILERELRNIESEIRIDRGAEQGSSYWSM